MRTFPHRSALIFFLLLALVLISSQSLAQTPAPSAGEVSAVMVERPLPEIHTLLRSLQDNQKNVEQIVKNYIFIREEQQEELDGDGRIKKTTTNRYETFYVGRTQISRLLSRDGKPLTPKEEQKEAEDVQKQIKKAQERKAKAESGDDEDREKKDFSIGMFLRACRMVNPRREQFRGHEVIAFDFEPNPQFKPSSKAEEIAQKLSGTVWVDEQARQIVRLESRLLDGVKFGGFLASLKKGAAITFEQQKVNDEVWLPSLVDANLSVRVIFKGKNAHVIERFSDYRKFRVDTAIKPVEPGQ